MKPKPHRHDLLRDGGSAEDFALFLISTTRHGGVFTRSQTLALQEMNNQPLRIEDVGAFMTERRLTILRAYANYSFEEWLEYMKKEVLALDQRGNSIGITVRGGDFLKYVFHYGYPVNNKVL